MQTNGQTDKRTNGQTDKQKNHPIITFYGVPKRIIEGLSAEFVNVWRVEGEHLEDDEAEGKYVRLGGDRQVLHGLKYIKNIAKSFK